MGAVPRHRFCRVRAILADCARTLQGVFSPRQPQPFPQSMKPVQLPVLAPTHPAQPFPVLVGPPAAKQPRSLTPPHRCTTSPRSRNRRTSRPCQVGFQMIPCLCVSGSRLVPASSIRPAFFKSETRFQIPRLPLSRSTSMAVLGSAVIYANATCFALRGRTVDVVPSSASVALPAAHDVPGSVVRA